MTRRSRGSKGIGWGHLAVALGVLASGCTHGSGPPAALGTPTPPSQSAVSPQPIQPASLCRHPKTPERPGPTSGTLPPPISDVAGQVEEIRELRFVRPVVPEAVSQAGVAQLLQGSLDHSFPEEMESRRGKAWAAIGVIPPGTDLRQAIVDYAQTQIIGFYDTESHRLVFVGSSHPDPFERMTLAHELTHALDDQAFGLGRLDRLQNACQDELLDAFVALAEGDAVETQLAWARRFLSPDEKQALIKEQSGFVGPPASVPPFLVDVLQFPYTYGRSFIEALLARGGEAAVNDAFRHPPTSTEQILHPSKYPNDQPQNVPVPELREKLGGPWADIDDAPVGEGWLRTMLSLRLSDDDAATAAAGWDGGQYRAWNRGDETAVLLETVWDGDGEARQFASAMGRWIEGQEATVERRGNHVAVLFGSDHPALEDLERAAG